MIDWYYMLVYVGNFDYPLSYNKTPKHVITFFIIFILKTLQPRRLWFRISHSPISCSLPWSWPCMAWSWQWPFIGLYLKVLLGSEPPSWTLLSFSILSLAVSDLGIWPKFYTKASLAPISGAINFVWPLDQFSVLTILLKTLSFGFWSDAATRFG